GDPQRHRVVATDRCRVTPGLHLSHSDNVGFRRGRLVCGLVGLHHPAVLPRSSGHRVERPARRTERSMNDRTSFYPELAKKIAPREGRLAVLLPGLGAVSTTLIAGVHLIRRGLARPFGSVTQMQKLRLGKRTHPRFTFIKDLVPLAGLENLAFGGWDIFTDDA